jgi:TolA-binding protein
MKPSAIRKCLLMLTTQLFLLSCVTPAQKKEMLQDIQNLKLTTASLQTSVAEGKSISVTTGEVSQRSLASTSSELERMSQDMKRIKGDIDALKLGVGQGQMPGQDAPEGGVVNQLNDLRARLDELESRLAERAQQETISAKKPEKKPSAADRGDLAWLESSFQKKRFKDVVEDAPAFIKRSKGRDRENAYLIFGSSLMKLNRHKEAALKLNELIDLKPSDAVSATAKLKMAECFKAMGDKDTARLFYEEILARYPESPEAPKAKKSLNKK